MQRCAVCRNEKGLEKPPSQLDEIALRVYRRWTRSTLVKSPMGLHPPVAVGNNTMMIVANTAGQSPMLAASVMIIALARSASSQTCFRRRSWVQVVGTSGSVRAERTTDVAQVVKRWLDGSTVDTTKIDLTRSTNLPEIVPFLRYQISLFLRLDCLTHSRPPTRPPRAPLVVREMPSLAGFFHACCR